MSRPALNHVARGWKKVALILIIDLLIFNFAFFLSLFIARGFAYPFPCKELCFEAWAIQNGLFLSFLIAFGIPYDIWEFASIRETIKIGLAVFFTSVSSFVVYLIFSIPWHFSLNLLIITFFLAFNLMVLPRILFRLRKERKKRFQSSKDPSHPNHRPIHRVLMVGAGAAAEKILREIESHPELGYHVAGLVDDNPTKLGSVLRRKKVLGNTQDLPELIERLSIDEVLIAMPSVRGDVMRRVLALLAPTQAKVKTLPGLWELVEGNITAEALRKVKVEDLMDREPIRTNVEDICGYLHNKTVLVTGAGGSIGSELVRQIVRFSPKKIILLGRGENRIFNIFHEVRDKFQYHHAVPVIGDIRHKEKMQWLMQHYCPEIVFHAAAHKHVPLMETNPDEVITNNIMGTHVLLTAALQNGVKRFINISTDKAVHPINVMGASKRIIELMIAAFNRKNDMICTSVRFGNVLGSNGSVIHLFQQQLEESRCIKVTDRRMERYFMLIPEAVELVLQAGAIAQGNDIFVLKMGNQINIYDFAKSFIKLSGMEYEKDATIEIIGNRGNEKLSEELWSEREQPQKTDNPWILRIECPIDGNYIDQIIAVDPIFDKSINQLPAEDIKKAIYRFLKQADAEGEAS